MPNGDKLRPKNTREHLLAIYGYITGLKKDVKAKDKRISQANTQQSQLINQRKNNLPPIDFESNEDSLDGFDLAQFEPR